MKRLALIAVLAAPVTFAPLSAGGAQQVGGPSPVPPASSTGTTITYHGRTGQTDVRIPKVTTTPSIDGRLTDAAWAEASILTGFSQYHPVDRQPAADSTEVLVMYTDHAIYFGIRGFETHGAVTASMTDRDKIFSNDNVELLLDTFNDRRRALVFSVNPLGIQSDGTYAEGSGTDRNPDFLFESKGRTTEYGFEIEVRIPFKNIRYQQAPTQQWGIQVIRRVMHSGQEQTWTPAERGAASFLDQSGKLLDLTSLKRGLVMDVNPVMTQSTTGAPTSVTDPTWRYKAKYAEFGGNVRWGVTPNMSLNATVNPDFSQVEADVGQTIYDPRSAISFPEKRPFFLESSENFSVPNSLIYTRRIVSPQGAMKLAGKAGAWNVGVLSAQDDASAVASTAVDPFYNIVRLRRDVGPGSTAGLVYTDKVQGSNYNRVFGLDSRQRIGSRYVLSSQLASSFNRNVLGTTEGRPLFDFTLQRTGRANGFTAIFEGVHPEFVASSGFISRSGVARAVFQPRWTWFPKNSAIQSISFSPISDNTWEWDRFVKGTEPNDIKMNTSTTAQLKGGWFAQFYTWTETFKYPPSLYANYYVERYSGGVVQDTVKFVGTDRLTNIGAMTSIGTPQWKKFSGSLNLVGGQDDNFDEWSSAWIAYTTVEGDWRPTDKIRVNGRYLEQRVHRKSDGSLVRLRSIPRLKLEYQVSRPIFVRIVTQYDGLVVDSLRDDSRSNFPILLQTGPTSFVRATNTNRGGLRADWLFSYQPNPGTVFFMGYGATVTSDEFKPTDMQRTADGFFIKLSYVFRA